jgi:hypothetical protein
MDTPTQPESAGTCGQSTNSADILRTDEHAHLKAAWDADKRIRLAPSQGKFNWRRKSENIACFCWSLAPSEYEIHPDDDCVTPAPDYGEPWKIETFNSEIGDTGDFEGHVEILDCEKTRRVSAVNPDDDDACQSLADPVKEIQAMRGRIERQRKELSRIQGAVSKAENSSREAKNKSGIYASIVDKVRRLLNAELEESTERAAQRSADEIQEMREAIMEASGIVEMIAESDLSHNSLPMCPECHAISSYEEMHAESCKIGQLLAKFQPFIKP